MPITEIEEMLEKAIEKYKNKDRYKVDFFEMFA